MITKSTRDNLKYDSQDKFLLARYDDRDNAIMANHVFHSLCELDKDRRSGRDPQWRDIGALADEVRAIDNRIDVAYITE